MTFDHFPSRLFVVALVQTQVLGDLLGGLRALDHNGIQSGLQELEIRHVRSGHDHRKRAAVGLHKYRAFDSVLGPIGGVRLHHWTVVLDDPEEVEAVRERVRASGIATEEREGGGFLVRDPWGIAVLFVPAQSLEA